MDSLSSSTSTKMKNNNKLSVRNQTRFKKPFLLLREKTILKKALELSILCDNDICVIHYDREGNLVNTYPEDQCQVKHIVERYRNLRDGEKIKKNTNLSQFYNKKLVDEKRRSLTDAEERKRFTKKVGEFKSSLEHKLQIVKDRVRDLLYSQDHQTEPDQSTCLDVMSQQNHNFPTSSSGFFPQNDLSSSLIDEEDPLMNFCPQVINNPVSVHQQQIGSSLTNLLMSGDASGSSNDRSKFSMFLFNHETATFTPLPNSVSSSFDQGLTPCSNNLITASHGAQGFNFGCSNNLNTQGFNFGCNNNLCT
uniref:MADS-box domain-containing protein n=2 Tax=Brassica campestris TaxID=3711 RepID=M4DQH4_BRACM